MSLSIVIPVHNGQGWIGETLDSVFRQTYSPKDMDLIIVDDASGDQSAAIAQSFLRDRQLNGRVVSLATNVGVSAARNVGWKLASGQWIQFLDADDLLAPWKLEIQLSFAEQVPHDVAVIYSKWQHLGLEAGQWQPMGPIMEPSVDEDTVLSIVGDRHFGFVGPTLIRRSFLDAVGGFDEQIALGEDYDLMLRLAMAGWGFREAASSTPLFQYRDTPGSLWRQSAANLASMRNFMQVSRRAETFLRAKGELSENAQRALAMRYSYGIDFFYENDRDSFHETLEWIRGLGLDCPPESSRRVQIASRLVTFENTQHLRYKYLRARDWLNSILGA